MRTSVKEKARTVTNIIYGESASAEGDLFGIGPEHRKAVEKIVERALSLGETISTQEQPSSFPYPGGTDD